MLKLTACLLALLTPALAHGASVRLLTGEYYEGRVDLAAGGVSVFVTAGSPVSIEAAKLYSAVFRKSAGPTVATGVVLTNGTILGGVVKTIDGPTIAAGLPPINLPLDSVAWVIFGPSSRETLLASTAPNRTGALLVNGDFFPGTVQGIKENKLEVSSVLFGPRKLILRQQVTAVQLHSVKAVAGQWRIMAKDGAEYSTDAPNIDHSGIALHDAVAGDIKLKPDDVVEIHAGAASYQSLADLKPQTVTPPAGVNAGDAFKVADAGEENPTGASRMVTTVANAQVAYAVPAGFGGFACTVGVPKDVPAACRLAFILYGDGRLLVRSPPQGPADKPQALHANLAGVHVLTLRVESVTPLAGPVMGQWIEPIFPKS